MTNDFLCSGTIQELCLVLVPGGAHQATQATLIEPRSPESRAGAHPFEHFLGPLIAVQKTQRKSKFSSWL